jgi:hypothetical protein
MVQWTCGFENGLQLLGGTRPTQATAYKPPAFLRGYLTKVSCVQARFRFAIGIEETPAWLFKHIFLNHVRERNTCEIQGPLQAAAFGE